MRCDTQVCHLAAEGSISPSVWQRSGSIRATAGYREGVSVDGDAIESARRFLAEHHQAVLVTRRRDGSLQSSPVTAGLDSEGRAAISSRAMLAKVRNLRRDPRATLCVVTSAWFGRWLQLDGPATVHSLPEALEPLVELYRSVRGEHPDWADYRAAMVDEERVLITIDIERVAGPALD